MKKIKYPILSNAFNKKDIDLGVKVLKSKYITMSKHTKKFEKYFAKKMNCRFALMVNSGSSANLLAASTIINPLRKNRLKAGDEVLIPALCWSTSLWPLVQNNLKPVFVDINIDDFNISIDDLKKKITNKTRAIMCVHILGTSSNMIEISKIAKKNNLEVIEDTCESLGAKYNHKFLGNYGNFGTYSFYYSHQITSGEGGMIVCKNKEDFEILKMLRSHGWSRDTSYHKKYSSKYKNLDEKFLFVNSGYNLRPTDIQAAIAHNQFKRLKTFMKNRDENRNKIISKLKENKKWNNQFKFVPTKVKVSPSWFGLPLIINEKYLNKKKFFTKYLSSVGIENRPILSGNFLNQPSAKLYKLNNKSYNFPNSEKIQDQGFFIGLHTKKISSSELNFLTSHLLKIDEI